jgi:2Fe-2S ferredoxin
MGFIHVTDRQGQRHSLEAVEGWRVMEIIRDWGLPIEGICGGAAECGTCHVFIHADWMDKLYPPREDELLQLDELPVVETNSRLSCQVLWTEELDGLELTLAPQV